MNKPQMVENNKILEYMVGSHLYGLATPESDLDFAGVFIPDKEFIYGFQNIEEVDLSIESKSPDGRNDANAVDRKMYTAQKFLKLAMECNPNIIEQVFVNESNIIYKDTLGQMILDNKHIFPSKLIKHRFGGYAISQQKKMLVKPDNLKELMEGKEILEKWLELDAKEMIGNERFLNHMYNNENEKPVFEDKKDHVKCGDLNFQKHVMVKKAYKMIDERLSKASHRKEGWLQHGYDLKFCHHYIRLFLEGIELFETGSLQFPLRHHDLLMDIKTGKYKLNEVMEIGEFFDDVFNRAYEKSELPSKPNYDKVNQLCIDIHEQFLER
ncbi:nucleotidyltransferase domain-containing protein [uncultured Arcobacter sp.]|uniref:DNA polymerase beta superfamily protein n=1 Tax=uncultured Arcobacter sp. TaxID=165434 RepID=UPI0026094305|nr:nucleotidyltransferase domain-containing protein [uncultured Arcobacter sp.]